MLRKHIDQAAAAVTNAAARTAERVAPRAAVTERLHGADHARFFRARAHTCSCGGADPDCCGKQIARADRERR